LISLQKRAEVVALLAANPPLPPNKRACHYRPAGHLTQCDIAALTGVSRALVQRISTGVFAEKYKPKPECAYIPADPYQQCEPGIVRAAALHAKSRPHADVPEEEPRLELDEKTRKRYRRLRRRIRRRCA
jgi:transcriptional regulator with XRE-family HTH domain